MERPTLQVEAGLDRCWFPKRAFSPSSPRDVILGSKDY